MKEIYVIFNFTEKKKKIVIKNKQQQLVNYVYNTFFSSFKYLFFLSTQFYRLSLSINNGRKIVEILFLKLTLRCYASSAFDQTSREKVI